MHVSPVVRPLQELRLISHVGQLHVRIKLDSPCILPKVNTPTDELLPLFEIRDPPEQVPWRLHFHPGAEGEALHPHFRVRSALGHLVGHRGRLLYPGIVLPVQVVIMQLGRVISRLPLHEAALFTSQHTAVDAINLNTKTDGRGEQRRQISGELVLHWAHCEEGVAVQLVGQRPHSREVGGAHCTEFHTGVLAYTVGVLAGGDVSDDEGAGLGLSSRGQKLLHSPRRDCILHLERLRCHLLLHIRAQHPENLGLRLQPRHVPLELDLDVVQGVGDLLKLRPLLGAADPHTVADVPHLGPGGVHLPNVAGGELLGEEPQLPERQPAVPDGQHVPRAVGHRPRQRHRLLVRGLRPLRRPVERRVRLVHGHRVHDLLLDLPRNSVGLPQIVGCRSNQLFRAPVGGYRPAVAEVLGAVDQSGGEAEGPTAQVFAGAVGGQGLAEDRVTGA
mmetsp:Transcript_22897/g.58636  ORF Transcript_22897/g.58636 Transcript_22897/m.58636 type:complete len:446 (-) Transcript_22897:806-2143(-)